MLAKSELRSQACEVSAMFLFVVLTNIVIFQPRKIKYFQPHLSELLPHQRNLMCDSVKSLEKSSYQTSD